MTNKNIYLLTQSAVRGYDTYDSCVVIAKDEDDARLITPNGKVFGEDKPYSDWAKRPEDVSVTLIGKALKDAISEVVCASFNAG